VSDGFLDILDLGSSNMLDEGLHLSFIDHSIMVIINGGEQSIELLFGKSSSLTKFIEVLLHKALHLSV